MKDLYVYNATQQHLDASLSILDLDYRRESMIPPGWQGHLSLDDQKSYDAAVAFYTAHGVTCRSTPYPTVPVVEIAARPHIDRPSKPVMLP
jgi:hypothetical protein